MRIVSMVCFTLLLSGCSSPPSSKTAEAHHEAEATPSSRGAASLAPQSPSKETTPPATPSEPSPGEQAARTPLAPPRQAEEIDVNYEDCTVLAETYKKVWLRNALERGAAAKDGELREAAEASQREAAETAGENWLKACARIVGTRMVRRHLVCASRAKTLQRFNDCYDGKGD
ncbi:MAG: hypothetical protein FJ095_15155 [Deltaproteobacteria bacterium]|nr:hypothetical protein [Deltaproteobacteria bacterium]